MCTSDDDGQAPTSKNMDANKTTNAVNEMNFWKNRWTNTDRKASEIKNLADSSASRELGCVQMLASYSTDLCL